MTDGVLEVDGEALIRANPRASRRPCGWVEGGDGVCERTVEVGVDCGDDAQPMTLLRVELGALHDESLGVTKPTLFASRKVAIPGRKPR